MTNTMTSISRRRALSTIAAVGFGTQFLPAQAKSIKPDGRSALIVVDVQNCFIEGGTLPVKGGSEVIPVINKLSSVFENIVVTQDWHTASHASFASTYPSKRPFDTAKLSYGSQVLWPDHCVQGTYDAELHKELKLPSAQILIRKGYHSDIDSYSAFEEADRKTKTGLAGYLKERKIDTVYVTGLATDFCVAWTALDAKKLGFKVYVIEDATRAIDLNGSLKQSWERMSKSGINKVQSADLLS